MARSSAPTPAPYTLHCNFANREYGDTAHHTTTTPGITLLRRPTTRSPISTSIFTTHKFRRSNAEQNLKPVRRHRGLVAFSLSSTGSHSLSLTAAARKMGLREMGECPVSASGAICRTCFDANADRHMVKRALSEPKAMPRWALNISVNPHYPLLSNAHSPLLFVRPADVMPPTATEAEFGAASHDNNLPVMTLKSLSARITLKTSTRQPLGSVAIGTPVQPPATGTIAPTGKMGSPSRLVKK